MMELLLAAVQASDLAVEPVITDGAVRCTLSLTELTATVNATDAGASIKDLVLEGTLPAGAGKLTLSPEKGVGGVVGALREIEVDDKIVDDAWVIRGDEPALLLALVPTLRTVAARAPSIRVDGDSITIRFHQTIAPADLGGRVHEALTLWERAASFRIAAG